MGSHHDKLINPLGCREQRMSVSRLAVISSGQAASIRAPPTPTPSTMAICFLPSKLWLKSPVGLSLLCHSGSHKKFVQVSSYDIGNNTHSGPTCLDLQVRIFFVNISSDGTLQCLAPD